MQHSFKNANVRIDGAEIIAESINLSVAANMGGVFKEFEKDSYQFSPNGGIDGSMGISYVLTGSDPLKSYTYSETGNISGNFGGLYFTSGYLTSYNVEARPNFPVKVDATIKFFDSLSGSFAPSFDRATDYKVLNISDVTVTGSSLGSLDDIDSVSYSFSSNVTPQYIVGESTPRRIFFENKEATMTINGAHITGNLPPNGIPADYQITLTHPELTSFSDVIFVNGSITSRSINTQVNGEIKNSLTIMQNYVVKRPQITRVSPSSNIRGGQIINIIGVNLLNTDKVLFCINGESIPRREASFIINSDTLIKAVVPNAASRGMIELRP